jgi:tetraacyldisaccharide 4'-kinase
VPVIAIGNFTTGGAGKTPTAMAIARLVQGMGFAPIIVMRGYGGSETGPLLVDARRDTARTVGDEALMIALTGIPVVIARDRAKGAELAIASGADLIILDDGFQSPALARDLALVVVDDGYGVGNGRVLPAGPLRVPLDAQMAKAQAVIVIASGGGRSCAAEVIACADTHRVPVLKAWLQPDPNALVLDDREIVAFAGIGRPEKLAEGLIARGGRVRALLPFPDHHRYTSSDARAILAHLETADVRLVTTAKDKARMIGEVDGAISALAARVEVEAVSLRFEEDDAVATLIAAHLPQPTVSNPIRTGANAL